MKKFAFIGGGSFTFTRNLVRDILTFPAFQDAEIALMDIDAERLGYIKQAVEKIIKAGGYPATVTATMDRVEALKGADGVLCTILAGDVDVWKYDVLIPEKYGVDVCVGDTRGPSGIFRFLRTVPVMLSICEDIEKYCPNAVFLNYTNPMAMLCRAMQEKFPNLKITGLCHSVQGTAELIARMCGVDPTEIDYTCAGINHEAFFLKIEHNGKDLYPALREAMKRPEIYNKQLVRNDMFLHLGYYMSESSGHNSEYLAWYRKRPDLIEKYCIHGTDWNPGVHAYILNDYLRRKDTWRDEIKEWLSREEISLKRGNEYAAYILNAVFGDNTLYKFNANVRNEGLVENLPYGACVEVPAVASRGKIEPIAVGKMPDHLACLVDHAARVEELAVKAALTGNKDLVYYACYYDPLSMAVLSLEEIKQMVDEMFEQNKEYLTEFTFD